MEKGIRKPKNYVPQKKTVNQDIALHGLTEQLLEVEYQKQKLEQSAYDLQVALGMTVEPVETISLGYDIELHGFKISIVSSSISSFKHPVNVETKIKIVSKSGWDFSILQTK